MDMSKRRRLLNNIDILVKRPQTMHEQSVNEILNDLQDCLRETLQMPSFTLRVQVLQSDVDKMAAHVKAANDADGQ
mgnify:FL=1